MQKKKILFVVEAFGGGIFTYVADLVNELSEHYDFTIAYALRSQTPKDFKSYFKDNINFIEVKHFTRGIQPLDDLQALFEIKKIAKEVNPDIIHLHSSKAGVLGRLAFWFHKVPLFYTPHGYSFLMQEMSVVKRKIYFLIEKVMTFNKCITISCSEGEHSETLRLTKRAKYVNNGIDIEKLDHQLNVVDFKSNSKSFVVFTIGRICYQKNPPLFNDIASQMSDVDFLWIGDGERREELTSNNIKITGWVDRKQVLQYAQNADVFILPSRWEGLPISLLEVMYMQKPCVVSDIIGNHDVIDSGRNGVVCNTADEFVAAIKKLKSDNEFSKKCCEQAYSDVINEYNTKTMAQRYMAIYENGLK